MKYLPLLSVQIRKRLDTPTSMAGYAILSVTMAACVAIVLVGGRDGSVSVRELISAAGLPFAVGALIIGVGFGAGDASAGGEREELLAGYTRIATLLSRLAACGAVLAAALILALVVAALGVCIALILGIDLVSDTFGRQLWEVAWFAATGGAIGFAIGASFRSFALALTAALLGSLVVDTALSFVGGWGAYIRIASLQGVVSEGGLPLPAICAGCVWVVFPMVIGMVRALRVEP